MEQALRKQQMSAGSMISRRGFDEIWDHRTGDYRGREKFKFSVPVAVKGYDRTGYERFREGPVHDFDRARMRDRSVTRSRVMFLLRLSLAAVFFWFGLLKLMGVSPVIGILQKSLPLLATSPYLEFLGIAEIAIAVGLIVDRLASPTVLLMIVHLCATLSVALISPHMVFAPAFPVLTMEGEFLAKNLVLIAAGLVIRSSNERRREQ